MADMIKIDGGAPDDERFSRFTLIHWWDQERLRRARVLVIGAGALGNEIIKNCALLGVGNVLVADMDTVENSNLSRSVLFRASDNGVSKAEAACRAARDIYPGIRIRPWHGNIVYDLGLGAYFWADVIIGGLDNREARVAVNAGAFFAGRPWIDGAVEVLGGVARLFVPGAGPCYECTMSEVDWRILRSRRSCALLTRDDMQEGKVPTTPTTASIIAGVQAQEAVKLLHGMATLGGKGFVFSGLTGESYLVTYPRKPDCFAHDACEKCVPLGSGAADVTVRELLARAKADLGADAVIGLSRDIIARLVCPSCGRSEEVFRSLGKVTQREAACSACGQTRAPETIATLGLDKGLDGKTFAQIGVAPFDVVTARSGERTVSYLFDGDADKVLGDLERGDRQPPAGTGRT